MKLLTELRVTIEKKSLNYLYMRYNKVVRSATWLERFRKVMEPTRRMQAGRELRAAVLHGSRNLKLEYIPEKAIQPTQVLNKISSARYLSILNDVNGMIFLIKRAQYFDVYKIVQQKISFFSNTGRIITHLS